MRMMATRTIEQPAKEVIYPIKESKFSKLKRELVRGKHYYILMAPYMIIFTLFTIVPVMVSLILSFFSFNMLELPTFVGWENYSRLFLNDDIFMISLKNTLIFAAITGPISYIACFLFAWIINELSPKVRAFMTVIFYAPSISGNVFFYLVDYFFLEIRMDTLMGFSCRLDCY